MDSSVKVCRYMYVILPVVTFEEETLAVSGHVQLYKLDDR